MQIEVVIATTGRASVVTRTVHHLAKQTRQPNRIHVVAVTPADTEGLNPSVISYAARGLCSQRNYALDNLTSQADIIVFFDDDFTPCDNYLEEIENLFDKSPEIVGATGYIIADGVRGLGISFDESLGLIARDDPSTRLQTPLKQVESLYGCNMTIRKSSVRGLRFDENLPQYGWLEDVDFTYRLGQSGRLVKSYRLSGVHLGVKAGRSPGRRLGYSQISNPMYLLRKKSMPPKLARQLMLQQVFANLARSFFPEPYVDRRGRLVGNLLALRDLLRGRLDPRRILTL